MAVCKLHQTSEKENLLSGDIRSLIMHAKSVTGHIDGSINELETSRQTILSEAESHRDKLIQRVHDSFKEFNIELINTVKEHKAIFAETRATLDRNALALASLLESLQQAPYSESSERKTILDLDETAEKVELVSDEIKILDLKAATIRCDLNMSIQPLVESKSKFGDVNVEKSVHQCELLFPDMQYPYAKSGKEDLKTVDDPQPILTENVDDLIHVQLMSIGKMNIKITGDTRGLLYTWNRFKDEGNIIIADFNNSKIKLYRPEGNLLSFLKLSSKPKEVSVLKGAQAVIRMLGKQMCKQIGIIDISESENLSWNGTIKTICAVGGITTYQNSLIITCDESVEKLRAVQMIDMDGNIVWTVTKDKHGCNLFDLRRFLTTRCSKDGETLIVTDVGKQSIFIIDALSGEVVKVCLVKGREPRGVCVDCCGNVYVCYKSGEITVWSRNMSEERCLVNDTEQLDCPLAMVYDRMRSELLVTSSSLTQEQFCNFMHRYKSF